MKTNPKLWRLLAAVVAAAVMSGCVSLDQLAPPIERLASGPGAPAGRLQMGREIYVTRCAKCHSVEPVRRYSRERWESEILPEMAKESKLSSGETDAVRAYILAVLGSGIS